MIQTPRPVQGAVDALQPVPELEHERRLILVQRPIQGQPVEALEVYRQFEPALVAFVLELLDFPSCSA